MVDFKKLCRACNSEKTNLLNFYSNDEEPTLGEMYVSITLLELHELDGLPQHICYPCAKKLEASYSFQKSCQKNDKQLKKIYDKMHQNKESDSLKKYENIECESHDIKVENIHNNVVKTTENSDNQLKRTISTEDILLDVTKLEQSTDTTIEHLPEVEDIFRWSENNIEKDLNEPPKKLERLSTVSEIDTIEKQQIFCDECDKKFFTKAALILHKKLHKKNKKTQEIKLAQNEKNFEQTKKVFQCKFCKKIFVELVNLKNHIFQNHGKELVGNFNHKSIDGKISRGIVKHK